MNTPDQSSARGLAPMPLAIGLAMMLMSLAAVAHRLNADFSMAIAAGGALVLVGIVWAAAAVHRVRRRDCRRPCAVRTRGRR